MFSGGWNKGASWKVAELVLKHPAQEVCLCRSATPTARVCAQLVPCSGRLMSRESSPKGTKEKG